MKVKLVHIAGFAFFFALLFLISTTLYQVIIAIVLMSSFVDGWYINLKRRKLLREIREAIKHSNELEVSKFFCCECEKRVDKV